MAKNQHVIPYEGEWAVKGEGNDRATSVHRTQAAAIDAAREIARKQKAELIIHRSDGRIRGRDSYGSDPLPPKGPRKVLFPLTRVSNRGKIRTVVREVVTEHRDKVINSDRMPTRDQRN